jgi:uncharacterized protein YkwD
MALALTLLTPTLVLAWSDNSYSSSDESLLVQLTNQARAAAGLPALKVDPALTSMARWRSKDMIDRDYFCHRIPPTGAAIPADCSTYPTSWPRVFDYLKSSGYCYIVAGENIGTNNYPDDVATAKIQDGFMGSPGHRANILGTGWDMIGVGAYKGSDGHHMWTVLFADKCGTAPAATPKPTPKPTPKATPKPTPRPTPKPTPRTTSQPAPVVTAPPTAEPTAEPTPVPTPDTIDLVEQRGGRGGGSSGLSGGIPEPLPSPIPTTAPPEPGADEPSALRVLETVPTNGFVDAIVSDVAGSFFGR